MRLLTAHSGLLVSLITFIYISNVSILGAEAFNLARLIIISCREYLI